MEYIDTKEDNIYIAMRQINALLRRRTVQLYENQLDAASEIVNNFNDKKVVTQLALAQMQSGKTGAALAVAIKR